MPEFTAHANRAITNAHRSASRHRHGQARPVHLLVGMVELGECAMTAVLARLGFTAPQADAALGSLLPTTSEPVPGPFAPAFLAVLRTAGAGAGEGPVTVDALAAALLAAADADVEALLARFDLSGAAVLAEVADTLQQVHDSHGGGADSRPAADPVAAGSRREAAPEMVPPGTPCLDQFGTDLTAAAAAGQLDPVCFREPEVERLVTVLARRTKNCPVLVGHPGVGKTAVLEGLAQRIAAGQVPQFLAGARVVSLDLASVVAGSKHRGDFEERVTKLLAEARGSDVIVFIDEIHTIVGAGGGAGGQDLANMLKPAIARGALRLVGATTFEEFRLIEKDPALERRFAKVVVDEPTVEVATAMMGTVRTGLEAHHGVRISDAALAAAVRLSDRFINDRFLPDKAIDVLDETCAAAAIAMMRAPEPAAKLYRQRGALRRRAAAATSDGEVVLTAEIGGTGVDLGAIDVPQVTATVARLSGVPDTTLSSDATQALRDLPDRLASQHVGQPEAVRVVSAAVRRARLGLAAGTRPCSFLFAGPTGVGKTELVKALHRELFGAADKSGLVRLDMSEFAEKASTARLFGAPPGYVGHDEAGQLTEAVRRNPYSIILLDEVEKAHPEVFDALLAVLEDGRMTDGQGRAVDFRNTVIVMTTNLGSGPGQRRSAGFGDSAVRDQAGLTLAAVRAHFRPEFVNRLDEIVVFNPLSRTDLAAIVELLLADVRTRLAERGIELHLDATAVEALLRAGYDPTMGARPLRRAITALLVDPLSEALLGGSLGAGHHVHVTAGDGPGKLLLVPLPAPATAAVPA